MPSNPIRSAVQSHDPVHITPQGCHQAAVVMLLGELDRCPQMFFIQRALHERDPWSGQIAFPGGSRDTTDPDTLHTARRETLEEVGISLDGCRLLGQLDDQKSHIRINSKPLVINCFVFEVPELPPAVNGDEVNDSFWNRIDHLADPANRMDHRIDRSDHRYPAIRLEGGQVLWGLTYRFVQMLIGRFAPR